MGADVAHLLQPLAAQGGRIQKEAGEIAARMRHARNIAAGDRIAFKIVGDNRQDGRRRSRRFDRGTRRREENIGVELDELLGQLRKNLRLAARPARLDFHGRAVDIADVTQPLAQGIQSRRSGLRKSRMEKSDDRHLLRLLRLRQHRSRQRRAGQ
jgi:hypothetical protein